MKCDKVEVRSVSEKMDCERSYGSWSDTVFPRDSRGQARILAKMLLCNPLSPVAPQDYSDTDYGEN